MYRLDILVFSFWFFAFINCMNVFYEPAAITLIDAAIYHPTQCVYIVFDVSIQQLPSTQS